MSLKKLPQSLNLPNGSRPYYKTKCENKIRPLIQISHNVPYLPSKILHNLCFSFLLGITAVPREIEKMLMQNFGVQMRCMMGDVQVPYEQITSNPAFTERNMLHM